MPLRMIEIFVSNEEQSKLTDLLVAQNFSEFWTERIADGRNLVRVLLRAEQAEGLLDAIEGLLSGFDKFRLVLVPVEATIPRLRDAESDSQGIAGTLPEPSAGRWLLRVIREELYNDVVEGTRFSPVFLLMVVLSTFVAAVGLQRNDVAVIIGAMVIAPLLGPNVALSLATALGDSALAKKSLKTSGLGMLTALVVAFFVGRLFDVHPAIPAIELRTRVGLGDFVLAAASGTAGVLAFTSGAPSALVGVMVSVSLLPPIVTFALLMACGHPNKALGALLLLFTNVICVNLSGVVTFLAQGVRPRNWWEAHKAKTAIRTAIVAWVITLAVLVVVLALTAKWIE